MNEEKRIKTRCNHFFHDTKLLRLISLIDGMAEDNVFHVINDVNLDGVMSVLIY
jgi:hypothetical protein